jgi:D-arabinose 1-dehydrogenase-like Zn-dependent alcohol dehydrogenase
MSSVTYNVYRGSEDGKPIRDSLTSTLGRTDVFVKITHSGVCGTDEHCIHSPVALGHEGIGIVQQIGSNVTSFKVGDRVGFGYVKKSCGDCNMCLTGRDQYCSQVQLYGYGSTDTGSFSSGAVCDQSSLVPIPAGIDSANAAPLMCAGATVWEVLSKQNVKSTDRVGVVGMGGLGHLAIKIAAKMGLEVVVISGSDSKREEALKFGAKEFHVLRSGEPTPEGIAPLNHLLLCGSGKVNHDQ